MTSDIYISYDRNDDVDHTVRSFLEFLTSQIKIYTGVKHVNIHFDYQDVKINSSWTITAEEKIKHSHLFMPIITPSYFTSDYCAIEWDYSVQKQKQEDMGIIFPVLLIDLEGENYKLRNVLDHEQRKRLDQFEKFEHFNWQYFKDDQEKYEENIKNFSRNIYEKLIVLQPRDPLVTNYHIIDKEIELDKDAKEIKALKKKIRDEPRSYYDIRPVCVIYTGGTVGMIYSDEFDENSDLEIGDIKSVLDYIPSLKSLEFDIDFFSYNTPLDSSNINSDDWAKLAGIISELYGFYQGFVILHGSNTLAYTASALSFMFQNLDKPIIISGAEIPLVGLNTDANYNVIRAIQAAAPEHSKSLGNIPEVCVLYGNSLLRGNRSTKKRALSTTDGFYSPNYENLGDVTHDKPTLHHRLIRKSPSRMDGREAKLEVRRKIDKHGVMIIDVYPDMNFDYYSEILQIAIRDYNLKGLIIQTYGTGAAPDYPSTFIDVLQKLIKKNVVIINLTQSPFGSVELRLFENNARLFDIGVVNGGDMTLEAAFCKLKYLLGIYSWPGDINAIKQHMQIDLRGELTNSAYSILYHKNQDEIIVDPIFHGNVKEIYQFDAANIESAVLRIQNVEIFDFDPNFGEELNVKFYFNRSEVSLEETEEDQYYKIGSFKQKLDVDNIEGIEIKKFSKNIDVTDKIRRLIHSDTTTIYMQVVSDTQQPFKFESLKLTIFTHSK